MFIFVCLFYGLNSIKCGPQLNDHDNHWTRPLYICVILMAYKRINMHSLKQFKIINNLKLQLNLEM